MASARITHEKPQILPGKVFCRICGRLMLMEYPNYVCNHAMEDASQEYAEVSVNADTLRTEVTNRIMSLVLSDTTAQDVVSRVLDKIDEKTRLQNDQLAESRATLQLLKQRKSQLERFATVDAGKDNSAHQAEIKDVDNRISALEDECRNHQRDIETLNRANDRDLLRKNTFDLNTYIHPD